MTAATGKAASGKEESNFISILHRLDELAHDRSREPAVMFFHDDPQPVMESRRDSWSWKELHERARSVAGELSGTGATMRGARVLLVYPAGLAFMAAFFGCLYAGAVPVPVPTPRRSEGLNRWLHIARDADIAGVLCAADAVAPFQALVGELGHGFCFAPEGADPQVQVASVTATAVAYPGPQELAFLQYTSGSTSEPKGVMVTHGGMMANLAQIRSGFALTSSDRMACWLPHYHDMGLIGCLLSAVYNGFTVAQMAPAAFLRRPGRYLALATHLKATIIGGPNFAFDHCVRKVTPEARAGLDLGSVRIAFNGAETIRGETMRRFHEAFSPHGLNWEAFLCCYGMAEATLYLSGNRPGIAPSLLAVERERLTAEGRVVVSNEAGQDVAGCGFPADGLDLAIVDPTARARLPENAVGEIWVRGANLSSGYWNRATLNAEVFDQRLEGEGGWFRTGDLGFLRGGELFLTGRLKDMIVIRGQNHYPQDIERTASICHPALLEGMAGAFALERDGAECVGLVCEVSREALRGLDAVTVFDAMRAAVSREHDLQLASLALIKPGNLPRTPSGKVRRFACRARLEDGSLPTVARWDADFADQPLETRAAWRDELLAQPKSRHAGMLRERLKAELARLAGLPATQTMPDDAGFFDIGLDSVAVVEVASLLERELGLHVEPTVMFEHTTVAKLAAYLGKLLDAPAAEPAEPIAVAPHSAAPDELDMDAAIAAEIAALKALLQQPPSGKRTA